MVPFELRNKLRYIEIISNRGARSSRTGDFRSRLLGRGFEFDEHRPYCAGDDYRMIDWNVTARLQHPYLKKNFEEKELIAILAIDLSRSMQFTSGEQSKKELLMEVAATLAYSAVADGIRLGLLLFTSEVELFLPPKQGRARVWTMMEALWSHQTGSAGTNIEAALRFLLSALDRAAVIFFLSDFIGQQELALCSSYKVVARRHDFVPVLLGDPLEEELPEGRGLLHFRDPESGEMIRFALTPRSRQDYRRAVSARRRDLHTTFFRHGVQHVELPVDRNYMTRLMRFFFARKKRR